MVPQNRYNASNVAQKSPRDNAGALRRCVFAVVYSAGHIREMNRYASEIGEGRLRRNNLAMLTHHPAREPPGHERVRARNRKS
jgi:hypothetical protein